MSIALSNVFVGVAPFRRPPYREIFTPGFRSFFAMSELENFSLIVHGHICHSLVRGFVFPKPLRFVNMKNDLLGISMLQQTGLARCASARKLC